MLREETVFGPIHSRRLGNSLGINLLPEKGKFCNFDCIYCECGWNRDGSEDKALPDAAKVRRDLEAKLSELKTAGTPVDSITFSGDGEPTLNPEFPAIIDDTIALRDKYYPSAKVSVLSNATRVHIPAIFEALRKVDNPIMKLDGVSAERIERINHPAPGYDLDRVIESLKKFNGDFVLQTMFLRTADGFDSAESGALAKWMEIVRILRPREIMVYTIDRPTPEQGLEKFTPEEMRRITEPLAEEGFNLQIRG